MDRPVVDALHTLLVAMVTALVDDESAVKVSSTEAPWDPAVDDGPTCHLTVDVAKDDVGKLIGRNGKTAGAMRHVLGASSRKFNARSIITIPDKKDE